MFYAEKPSYHQWFEVEWKQFPNHGVLEYQIQNLFAAGWWYNTVFLNHLYQ